MGQHARGGGRAECQGAKAAEASPATCRQCTKSETSDACAHAELEQYMHPCIQQKHCMTQGCRLQLQAALLPQACSCFHLQCALAHANVSVMSRPSASTSAAGNAGMQATGDGNDACSFQAQPVTTLPRSTSWSLQAMQQLLMIHQEARICHHGSQKGCAHVRGSSALWHPIHTPSSNPQPTLTMLKPCSQSLSCTGCAQQSGVTKILLLMWLSMRLSSKACPFWWQPLS